MIVSPSIEGTARRLTELLPTVDLPDSFLQWQAQLLANYSGHVFVPHGVETSTPTLWQAVLESSLAQLSMQAEIAELRSQNEFLKSEQQRLEGEIKESETRGREQEADPAAAAATTTTTIQIVFRLSKILQQLLCATEAILVSNAPVVNTVILQGIYFYPQCFWL